MATHLSIDVDQTLLDDEGQLIPGVRENLASLKKRGLVLQLWSKGGSEYALETAEKWKLKEFFTSYAAKPDIAIYDLPEDTHPVCSLGVPFASATKVLNEVVADSIETTLCPSQAVVEMIGRLQKKKPIVKRDFGPVLRLDTPLHPIPFFGNLESAQVLTIGLNPSSTEFAPWRQWPTTEMDSDLLARRLASYFRSVAPRPHPWFGNYQEAIGILGANFKVNAAHVDLSPWSTLSPTRLKQMPDGKNLLGKYNELLELGQKHWLPQIISLCAKTVKLVVIVDSDVHRANKTAAICKTELGQTWRGQIIDSRSVSSLKLWAWKNRDTWSKEFGDGILFD